MELDQKRQGFKKSSLRRFSTTKYIKYIQKLVTNLI